MTEEEKTRRESKRLFSIEVFFYYQETEIKKILIKNLFDAEIMKYRETFFSAGVYFPVDPGHGVIVAPNQIKEIHVYRQDKFFE